MSNQLRIKDLAISENGFVFDPFSGGTFTLNATGQAVIKGLRDGLTKSEIVAKLTAEFDGVSNKLHEDVQEFIRTLSEFGLLSDQD